MQRGRRRHHPRWKEKRGAQILVDDNENLAGSLNCQRLEPTVPIRAAKVSTPMGLEAALLATAV